MKKALLILAVMGMAAGFAGCAPAISVKDEVLAIKKVGVVSLSTNSEIFNVKNGLVQRQMEDKQAAAMKVLLNKTADTTQDSIQKLLAATSGIYLEAFKAISHWNMLGIEEVKKMPAYQAAAGESTEDPNFLPVMILSETKYFNAFNQSTETWKKLTDLCNALQMDAVAVITTNLSYEPTGLQLIGGLGGLIGVMKSPAKPHVGTALAVVTKAGKSAVYALSGSEFIGDEVKMLQSGMVNFTGDDDKIIASYLKAVKASAASLVGKIVKEMNEK